MLIKMEDRYTKNLNDFLFKYNNLNKYYIAWIPNNYRKIAEIDKDNFFLCIEKNNIVGCIGTHISEEQKVVRLLGPIIEDEYFTKYVDIMYEHCLSSLPKFISEVKIAFYEENVSCKLWCEKNFFELYNAEITMVLNNFSNIKKIENELVSIKTYEDRYREKLDSIHPKNTFFTLNELIAGLEHHHKLFLAIEKDEVKGYVCYEQTKDKKQGEIILLHVGQEFRNNGYGSELLNNAIKNLIENGAEEITISVRVNNEKAQKLYKRIGFIEKETIYAYRKNL
ncbi:GNAT family N-acetyltransferase [Clostridium sp. YIM B02505]|uniref:GNAT family N-acetyltransferase n=1 Tax=Clostridium yunnanense TaxID=2800325 RepID=A0ABS1EPH9_9CLOT|nr:GNAT family N-acetyltransferase [Clostridium yunnanense]MBK1811183.1 GNAT family N-acetyltransferase [Clostridium yunnanense]